MSLIRLLLSLFLLLLSLFEILSPKVERVKASSWGWNHFNPGSQVALRRVLFDWSRVQRITVR